MNLLKVIVNSYKDILIILLIIIFITNYYIVKLECNMINNELNKIKLVNNKLIEKITRLNKGSTQNLQNFFSKQIEEKDANISYLRQNLLNLMEEQKQNYVLKKIQSMSEPEVSQKIATFFNISTDEQPRELSSKEFAIKLLSIATNENEIVDIESPFQEIVFSSDRDGNPSYVFPRGIKKIIAHFDVSFFLDKKVFIKWVNQESGKIELFNFYAISPDRKKNFVWLKKKKGWETGSYQVNIYSLNNKLKLVAYGSFEIE